MARGSKARKAAPRTRGARKERGAAPRQAKGRKRGRSTSRRAEKDLPADEELLH